VERPPFHLPPIEEPLAEGPKRRGCLALGAQVTFFLTVGLTLIVLVVTGSARSGSDDDPEPAASRPNPSINVNADLDGAVINPDYSDPELLNGPQAEPPGIAANQDAIDAYRGLYIDAFEPPADSFPRYLKSYPYLSGPSVSNSVPSSEKHLNLFIFFAIAGGLLHSAAEWLVVAAGQRRYGSEKAWPRGTSPDNPLPGARKSACGVSFGTRPVGPTSTSGPLPPISPRPTIERSSPNS